MWIRETKTKDGKLAHRYCTDYTDNLTGKKRMTSVTLPGKATAQNKNKATILLLQKIEAKQEPEASKTTLGYIYTSYIEDLQHSKKKSTCERNRIALGIAVDLIGKDVLAEKLTAHIIRNRLRKSDKKPKTLNEYLKRLRTMLRWAYRNDLITNISFLEKLEDFDDKERKKEVNEKFMERKELRELVDHLEHPIWKEVILFAALTGMRIGEVIALEKSDVDLDNRVIHITKNYDSSNKVVTSTKTIASNDTISIQDELVPVIKRINAMMARQKLHNGYRTNLFVSDQNGKHIHYYSLNKYFKENTEKFLGRKLTLHSLRHTHASLLFEAGFSVQEVGRRLRHGHNSKVTEEIYIHVTDRLKEKDAEKIKKVCML